MYMHIPFNLSVHRICPKRKAGTKLAPHPCTCLLSPTPVNILSAIPDHLPLLMLEAIQLARRLENICSDVWSDSVKEQRYWLAARDTLWFLLLPSPLRPVTIDRFYTIQSGNDSGFYPWIIVPLSLYWCVYWYAAPALWGTCLSKTVLFIHASWACVKC